MTVLVWLGVAALGGVGAVARVVGAHAVTARAGGEPMLGTLAINVAGAFVLGILAGAHVGGDALLLAGTATLGSFTTFSGWMLESLRAGVARRGGAVALNLGGSLALGLAAVALGHALGTAL